MKVNRNLLGKLQVYMFLIVPAEVERLMGYGFFQCMDAFLYLLTILPLRVAYSLGRSFTNHNSLSKRVFFYSSSMF